MLINSIITQNDVSHFIIGLTFLFAVTAEQEIVVGVHVAFHRIILDLNSPSHGLPRYQFREKAYLPHRLHRPRVE